MVEVRSRRWQLTENNPEYTKEECIAHLKSVGEVRYVIAACEMGESGTKHIHAFGVFKNAIRLTTLKAVFGRAHFEPCCGSNEDNVAYCQKQGDYIEQGVLPQPKAKKNVASEVVNLILEEGLQLNDIMREYPEYCDYIVKHFRSLKDIETTSRY